jgi:hypothetical protein
LSPSDTADTLRRTEEFKLSKTRAEELIQESSEIDGKLFQALQAFQTDLSEAKKVHEKLFDGLMVDVDADLNEATFGNVAQ